jgi:hypothetical protein
MKYEIECYTAPDLTEEVLSTRLGVRNLNNDDFTIELREEDAKIYFCSHVQSDKAQIAFANLIELALSTNDAVVITRSLRSAES